MKETEEKEVLTSYESTKISMHLEGFYQKLNCIY